MYQQISCQSARQKTLDKALKGLVAELAGKQAETQAGLERAETEVLRRKAEAERTFASLTAMEDSKNQPKASRAAKVEPSNQQSSRQAGYRVSSPAGSDLSKAAHTGSKDLDASTQLQGPKREKLTVLRHRLQDPSWLQALYEMQSASKLMAAQTEADIAHLELNEALGNVRQALLTQSDAIAQQQPSWTFCSTFRPAEVLIASQTNLPTTGMPRP